MEKEKVAIVKCSSYKQEEVDKAVKKALKLINFDYKKYKKILIKPNILGVFGKNQEAITTHPSIVRAIIKNFSGKIFIGESSFANTENVLKKTGYSKFKNMIIFEKEKIEKINDEKAKILKEFYLPKIVRESDLIVNVPKLKTHMLTKITGGVKNLYGCIPGGMKQVLHKKAIGDKKFSSMLVDIYQNINPGLNIVDGVVGMEGEGPSSGDRKECKIIIVSKNAIALDIVISSIIGYKPEEVFVVKEAVKRGLYPNYEVEIVGDFKEIPRLNFKKPLIRPHFVMGFLSRYIKENPIFVDKEKCTRCGTCERVCPVEAMKLNPYPEVNQKKCIRCFCCIESCPQHALFLKETGIRKIIKRIKNHVKNHLKK
ncbi:DUF362 domain-containing protein [Candidatus Pacearchaeota archaeon]|nr:DUF362 domain-containing protein [Candidatus Pacearchaeota archaeon]